MVAVRYMRELARAIVLGELKRHPELNDLPLVRNGNRLSVIPVTKSSGISYPHWNRSQLAILLRHCER
jgi:predicted RNA-binding protein with PUA-like domain